MKQYEYKIERIKLTKLGVFSPTKNLKLLNQLGDKNWRFKRTFNYYHYFEKEVLPKNSTTKLPKYQYKLEKIRLTKWGLYNEKLNVEFINEMGQKGWRLIDIYHTYFYFEKEVDEKDNPILNEMYMSEIGVFKVDKQISKTENHFTGKGLDNWRLSGMNTFVDPNEGGGPTFYFFSKKDI